MSYLNLHPNRERFIKVNKGPLECKICFCVCRAKVLCLLSYAAAEKSTVEK